MSTVHNWQLLRPPKVFFFISALYRKDLMCMDQVQSEVEKLLGPSQIFQHPFFPMKEYYSKEMGEEKNLERIFLVNVTDLQDREKLVDLKIKTEKLETRLRLNNNFKRILNCDPGLLSLENMFIATVKNFSHRAYLGQGVFSDLNYIFRGKTYQTLPWSYPDYSHQDVIEYFNKIRACLRKLINQ